MTGHLLNKFQDGHSSLLLHVFLFMETWMRWMVNKLEELTVVHL